MKKDYLAPELELITFSFESILEDGTRPLDTSGNENGGSDHSENDDEW